MLLPRVIKPNCDGFQDIAKSLIIWCFSSNRKLSTSWSKNDYRSNRPFKPNRYKEYDLNNLLKKSSTVRSFNEKDLEPFEKNFYRPHPSVLNRSSEEIQEFLSKNGITITGRNCPAPVFSFEEVGFPKEINDSLRTCNFSEPTVIQSQGWPIALSGRDLIGIARTGSGKTLGYILPALVHIQNQLTSTERKGPVVLVLTPTRELANQVYNIATKFSRALDIPCNVAYGGEKKFIQLRCFERGHGICIGTPGRVLDFLASGELILKQVTYLVLDEADTMFDMGFEPQMREIMENIRPDRQVLMWSATWPKEIKCLVYNYLKDYIKINVGSTDLMANPNITQIFHMCEEHEKINLLVKILQENEISPENKALVFAGTKIRADKFSRLLRNFGYHADALHGDKSQNKRNLIINKFRTGRLAVLVATDVAARGLDFPDVKFVINFDFPLFIESYVHRIGRTGRHDASGTAHSFITEDIDSKLVKKLIRVLETSNQDITPQLREIASRPW